MEYLLDIWMEILSRVGVKDLIQLKLVSKTFLGLISCLIANDNFIRLHFKKSSFRGIHFNTLVCLGFKQHGEAETSLRAIHIDRLSHSKQYTGKEVDRICYGISYGSCNGLVCLRLEDKSKYGGGVLLWNPALDEAEYIPVKCPQQTSNFCSLSWFGYDDGEYKLILGTASHFHLIRLYNAWNSSVKIDENYGYEYCDSMGTLVHRNVHWPVYYKKNSTGAIISYDLSNETVGRIATPFALTIYDRFVLGQVGGCLSAIFRRHSHLHQMELWDQMELWVMKEYGVQESWTKLMILPSRVLSTYRSHAIKSYAIELDDPAQLSSPIYGKNFYVESLISPRSIRTKMC